LLFLHYARLGISTDFTMLFLLKIVEISTK
jgi:hypothetical protein